MTDVFGGRGGGAGSQPGPPPGPSKGDRGSSFIEYDNETGELAINLPPQFARYERELYEDLYQEFFLANPDPDTHGEIARFIAEWLRKRTGEEIELP